jgi:murein tripeptide amidase MpaA
MAGWLNSAQISGQLDTFATSSTACTRFNWAPGHAGASAGYVKVAATVAASPATRSAVLISGGVHARELAPPDAIVSFIGKLLTAYAASSAIVYPAWTSPVDGAVYDSFTIAWPQIQAVVERLDTYFAPCVNADGRDWAVTKLPPGTPKAIQDLHKGWRKNRRPAPAGRTGDYCVGVDLNRNFDILWDFNTHYDTSLTDLDVQTSDDPCDPEVYAGPAAESEPETQNLAGLMRSANISFFVDVHSYGRDILYPWGLDTDQSTDPAQNFANTAKDHLRDGVHHSAYGEYIPAITLAVVQAMARRMSEFILRKAGGSDPKAQARSVYKVMQSAAFYVTSGASDDYCFSRWFTAATAGTPISPVMAFTLEVGGDPKDGPEHDEGRFTPDYVKFFPKIEREVHAALWALLTAAAATGYQPPGGPAQPSPPKVGSGTCVVASAAYGDPGHPAVLFLRDVRDIQLRASRAGNRFATALAAAYARLSPPLAGWLRHRRRTRAIVRACMLGPLIATLRLVSSRTRRWPRLRSLLLALTFVLAAALPVALVVLVMGVM